VSNGRILLVDGDVAARRRAKDVLVAGGYDIVEFDDGARALAFLRKGQALLPAPAKSTSALARRDAREGGQTTLRPAVTSVFGEIDAIVVDWALPGLSGAEVLARLRGDGDERPVLVTAMMASADDVATMLSLGADDVLEKPLHQRMLLARVTAQLRRRRAPALSSGEVIDGRYRLEDAIGEGRVGVVWRAMHTELDIAVDVAVVQSRGSEALRAEAKRTASVQHPGFVRIRDVVRFDSSRHLAVADALPTNTVKKLIDGGELDADRAFNVATSVLDVLVALHSQGLAHKNISANSVFVDVDDKGNDVVRVVDGATLRLISISRKRVGMSAYVPPESTMAGPGYEADVYAVGRLLCHMLSGKPDEIPNHAVAPAVGIAVSHHAHERCSARALLRAVAIAGRSRRKKDRQARAG
jgi:DNA-binding response OmpR family regulator